MSQIGAAIRDVLITNTKVNNVVSGRVRFLALPQNAILPYLTYTLLSDTPSDTLQGMAGLFNCSFQIDCWAKTYGEAVNLGEKVRLALQGYGGINKGIEIQGIYLINEMDSFEAEIINYRKILRFEVWYKRPNPIFS